MSFIYFYLMLLIHPYLAMWWRSFELADRKSWEALIPVYNYYVAFKVFCKKGWWAVLLVIPGVHLVMWSVVNVSYIRRFGYYSLLDTIQGIIFPYILFFKIAKNQDKMLPETNWANSKEVAQREWGDHLVLFLSLPVIGHIIALGIGAVTRARPGAKTKVKEWGDSIIFALVAALIIRTYVFEPFRIPTGSMERTLLVGDFLFVNKLAYGPKVPVTPLSYPLVHNTVPWVTMKSYTTLEKGTYTRLPGFGKIQRYDVVVFNYPAGDTAVYDPRMPYGLMGHEYEGIVNNEAFRLYREASQTRFGVIENYYRDSLKNAGIYTDELLDRFVNERASFEYIKDLSSWKEKARKMIADDKVTMDNQLGQLIKHHGIIYRPVDKRENYIKRCVGMPGDYLEIKNSILYVNDKPAEVAKHQNLLYLANEPGFATSDELYNKFGIEKSDLHWDGRVVYGVHANLETIAKVRKTYPNVQFNIDVKPQYVPDGNGVFRASEQVDNLSYFPKDINVSNNVSNFGRFQVPFKGKVVDFTKENIAYYRRIITAYEGHKLEEKTDGIYIDGKKTTTYKVEMNYYWMMGDNRYQSADSRTWGFVPEDHIVGKASMTWFSSNPEYGIRWDRVFKAIK
ncbi:signal peptidase I [Crocinitomicaceae bacterium CZZ-1]|uniref:Signal peptidase I n=1 Tax=Taishania pollutisoli TaxID=2766479 RepID=A0A8J6TZV7_9FLAO|nr:signal peptidase I [Taishania pollutisoli]MBC9812668.1 signal peptidase I [Taishania pollutisoli]